jgi:hypothetical protein
VRHSVAIVASASGFSLWQMGRQCVLYGFIKMLGFHKLGKAGRYLDFELEDYNYYRDFTQAWVDGVHEYYCGLAGHALVADQLEMISKLEGNKGHFEVYTTMCWVLHFTELRRATQQSGDEVGSTHTLSYTHTHMLLGVGGCCVQGHQKIKLLSPSCYHILAATNHHKVADQLLRVPVGWYGKVLHPEMYKVYEAEWTKFMSNRESVGVGINHPVEDMNQQLNRKSKGLSDFRFLSDVALALNACKPVEEHINEWLGISHGEVRLHIGCLRIS